MVATLPPNELIELYQTARQVVWRYRMDSLETAALQKAMRSTEKAVEQILSNPSQKLKRWEQLRRQDLMKELDALTLGIREQVSGEISSLAASAGAESARFHSDTLSFGNRVEGFNNVALSPEQFKSFFQTTPLGGNTLNQWVDRAFNATVKKGIIDDLNAGVLQGKGYKGLVNNIMGHMGGFTRREAVTLARSYVQSANCEAMKSVMRANSDIVTGWRWSSVMEGGNIETGLGTCLICASLDAGDEVYPIGGGPVIPAHPNCRCFQVVSLVDYKELGLDVDELEEVARPWTIREDVPINEGGRAILEHGKHRGNYETWMQTRGEKFQKNVLGPKRYELWKDGKVKMKDLVDIQNMKLKRIDQLT